MGSGITRSEAVKRFLNNVARPDLAALYNADMECQINVAQGDGVRKDVISEAGTKSFTWTDGMQEWYNFRMPKNPMADPVENDFEINYELDKHVSAIGMTGWDWRARKSRWVAFDFDAIAGHSDKHAQTLSDEQLRMVREAACSIPWVTVRKSTGGKGLHLYVFVDGIDTRNHNEHAALARSILGLMSALTGFNFSGSVDCCGGNMWVWGRKMLGTDGLTLIKEGDVLYDIPPNWKDHIRVTQSRGKIRNLPQFINERELTPFEELAGQRPRVPLDEEHKKLIGFLTDKKAFWWWDNDHHMLVCHTYDLHRAHEELNMRGLFDTTATGRQSGGDHNCFCFPMRRGAWVVRRYSKGIVERPSWDQDSQGWTRCYINRDSELKIIARSFGGVEIEGGGFEFREAEVAAKVAELLGANLNVPPELLTRPTIMKSNKKDGRLIVKIKKEPADDHKKMNEWREAKDKMWTRIFDVLVAEKQGSQESEAGSNYDDIVRHLINETGLDCGWVIKGEGSTWNVEPLVHVKLCLAAVGIVGKEVGEVLGSAVLRCWRLVNEPFTSEYPGERKWNRNSAQFRFTPSPFSDDLSFTHWSRILSHVGSGLDNTVAENKWCKDNNISNGHDYLLYWCASLFQKPLKPLPYLFFHGPQNSGKSIFHEALCLLFEGMRGYARADAALINQSAFNGELENSVLCVVEETDLSKQGSLAYNRIKDWVTSPHIQIHRKNHTPYTVMNSCHFVHVSNHKHECPIFRDDTRITMGYVESLQPGQEIPKEELKSMLQKEAPDFLGYIMNLELPESGGRLALPVINTPDKMDSAKANQTILELFLEEKVFRVDGEAIKLNDLYMQFKDWLDPAQAEDWTKQKMTKELPGDIPKGRYKGADWHFGNISWTPRPPEQPVKRRLILKGDKLVSDDP